MFPVRPIPIISLKYWAVPAQNSNSEPQDLAADNFSACVEHIRSAPEFDHAQMVEQVMRKLLVTEENVAAGFATYMKQIADIQELSADLKDSVELTVSWWTSSGSGSGKRLDMFSMQVHPCCVTVRPLSTSTSQEFGKRIHHHQTDNLFACVGICSHVSSRFDISVGTFVTSNECFVIPPSHQCFCKFWHTKGLMKFPHCPEFSLQCSDCDSLYDIKSWPSVWLVPWCPFLTHGLCCCPSIYDWECFQVQILLDIN